LPKHKGYKVFFDNYFAFFELQEALLRDGIHSVATIRSNRLRGCPVMPSNELKRKGRGATDFCCTRDNKLCVVKWFDNQEVILTSTYKCVDPVEPVRRWDKRQRQFIDVPCPQIVKEYNQFMRVPKMAQTGIFLGNPRGADKQLVKISRLPQNMPSSLHEM
ncbi:PiggyBac transposable element-derived protein 1, partial [Trichinella pseudospiralis]